MPPLAITTLTPATVQQDLTNDGINALGLTALMLSTRWGDATPGAGDYSATALTLNITALHAPFRGIQEFTFSDAASTLLANLTDSATTLTVASGEGNRFPSPSGPGAHVLLTIANASGSKLEVVSCTARSGDSFTIERAALGTAKQSFSSGDKVTLRLSAGIRTSRFIGADGNPITGAATALSLHPQAALRLETLMAQRYGNPLLLPVPTTILVHGAAGFSTARWYEPDAAMTGINGAVSFHDARGFIVDPIYVATLFADLQTLLPGLVGKNPSGAASGAGGVQAIATAGIATGVLLHILDLHGRVYQPALVGATLVTKNGAAAVTGTVAPSGLQTLNEGDGIDAAATDAGRLRWGFATNGILGRTRLTAPTLTSPLARTFYQVAVVDTVWSLLGNRTSASVLGIPGDDQKLPADVRQTVRDNVVIDYLADGPDVLAQASAVLARPSVSMFLAVSPVLDGSVLMPTQPGANAHWPAFPAPTTGTGFPAPPASPKDGISAAFTAGNDVVVTIAADKVPDGAHIRIYPSVYVTIPAMTSDPSFLRGDGGAALGHAGTATQVLLRNPFNLTGVQAKPNPANLAMDIVVAPRAGKRKLWGNVSVTVAAGPAPAPANSFAGTNAVTPLPVLFESVAPSPLFNIPATVTPPGAAPSGVIDFIRALASESNGTTPRQGPRLPTMARFDTVIASGVPNPTPPTLLWEAVLSGGRWSGETRSAAHSSGNPGNPAGPDVHAPGIHVTGALAYDLARHAMRRAQPIIPLGAGIPGWVVGMDGNNFNPPSDTNTSQTGIGVVLETVAAVCETPELSALTPPSPGFTLQSVLNQVGSALHITPPTFTGQNEPRIEGEIRREFIVSANGLRDGLWALRRALREARELVYIESPQFAHTGSEADLVAELSTSLHDHPNLKLIVCTPREADFAQNYKGWSRQHFHARSQAVGDLLAVAPDRVAVFHPVGFPGRTAFIRTTTVIVDDVWCLTGATHFRRRGMTFDGSVAIASFDRQMERGYSKKIRAFRRSLMAAKMSIAAPAGSSASGEWLRLGRPESAFQLVADWLSDGGLGFIQPLWSGPADSSILPATDAMADPDGSDGTTFISTFSSLLAESGD